MRISCPCGDQISDSTDGIPYKARLLADQDLFNLFEKLPPEAENAISFGTLLDQTRPVYQCTGCGRLTLDDPVTGEMLWFAPENDERKRALGSIHGDAFKVILRGRWFAHSAHGDLWWTAGGDRKDGFERFDDMAGLSRRYHEVFEQLRGEARLLDAWLDDGDEMIHRWSMPNG